jgi:hypothetical protein
MIELCTRICPFNPEASLICAKCPVIEIVGPKVSEPDYYYPDDGMSSVTIDEETHVVIYQPEIIVINSQVKRCCYLDRCDEVPITYDCESVCYEPCDADCSGRCSINPQCPNECARIKRGELKIRYKIWLIQKLNEIKLKYRQLVEACILKTKLAMESELKTIYQQASTYIATPEIYVERSTSGHQHHGGIGNANVIIHDE